MSGFKWYPGSTEALIPWNAVYDPPSQTNKILKSTPRLCPKNGGTFLPGNVIRLEFPAQGYINPINTTLEFDVTLATYGTTCNEIVRFQNNINSIFSRGRLLYGANQIEEIINYGLIARLKTEWAGTTQQGIADQFTISQGIGGVIRGIAPVNVAGAASLVSKASGNVNVRQFYIQGIDRSFCTTVYGSATVASTVATPNLNNGNGVGILNCPNVENVCNLTSGSTANSVVGYCTRRYQTYFLFGLFNQDKLIPVKWMASQLAIEVTLEDPAACMIAFKASGSSGTNPTYAVTNVNMIPEILEFDPGYDAGFLEGLNNGGVPIKFSTWKTHIGSSSGVNSVNMLVQERSRSVKSLYAVQRRSPSNINFDSHATFFDTYMATDGTFIAPSTMQQYQYRIAGRYFPAAPVQLSTAAGSSISNGGAEAYVELEKALGSCNDSRLSCNTNILNWAMPVSVNSIQCGSGTSVTSLCEVDYATSITSWIATAPGQPTHSTITFSDPQTGNSFSGNVGSSCFTMATCLEASNGVEISGHNAEEQSDICFTALWSKPQSQGFLIEVYALVDSLVVLRPNNVMELIQ